MRPHILFTLTAVALFSARPTAVAQTPAPTAAMQIPRDTFVAWMSRLSNTGRWGAQDQLGTLNLITPAKRRAAAQSVRDGVSISLSSDLVAGPDSNALRPLRFGLLVNRVDTLSSAAVDTLAFLIHGYAYSHIDALSHFLVAGQMYNGVGRDQLTPEGAKRLGVEAMQSGIVTRGVIIDVPKLRGVPYLVNGDAVTPADLELWEKRNGTRIEAGDVVLIRTGRGARVAATGPWRVVRNASGPHPSLAAWLKSRDVAALGSDVANEVAPSVVPGVTDPMHLLSLIALGMPLMDDLDLEALAAEATARSRPTFLFVASPLRVRGGTGSPLNPLAIF
jgi:kynurenine formamidase